MKNVFFALVNVAAVLLSPALAKSADRTENLARSIHPNLNNPPKIYVGETHTKIREALFSEHSEDIDETPLDELIQRMADHYQIPILLDQTELRLKNIDPSTKVSLNVPPITLRSVLNLILAPLELDFVYRDEVLCITTKSSVDLTPMAMIYDLGSGYSNQSVAELLQKIAEVQNEGMFPKPVVHLLIHSAGEGKPDQLFVRANKRTHDEVQTTLQMLLAQSAEHARTKR